MVIWLLPYLCLYSEAQEAGGIPQQVVDGCAEKSKPGSSKHKADDGKEVQPVSKTGVKPDKLEAACNDRPLSECNKAGATTIK